MIGSSQLQTILSQITGTRAPRYATTTVPGGNTVANTTTETTFASSYPIPAGSVSAGDIIEVHLSGVLSAGVVVPTLQGKLKLGSTTVIDTGALAGLVNGTDLAWDARIRIHVVVAGSSGSVEVSGLLTFATAANAALTVVRHTTAAVAIDFSAAQAIAATATWSAASASNSITLRQMMVR